MIRGPQRCTRTDTLLPDTTLFRCRRGTVEGRRAGPGGDSGLRVRGRAAAGDRSCNLSSGYGFEQTVSSAWLNAGGYNSGPCIPPGSMSCMWYAIEGHDGNDVLARRRQARPEHLARLAALRDAGRLLLAIGRAHV